MIDKEDIIAEYEKQLQKKDNEIERLNKENKELDKVCARKSHYIDKKDLEITQKDNEIERLNNIIENMEEELMTIYLDIMEYNEDYAKREIKKLKGVDKK